MKTKKYISLLMAIIMMLSLFAGCGSEGNTPSVSDDKDTLYLRLSSALQSTDWQQTSAMEGNKITYAEPKGPIKKSATFDSGKILCASMIF